MNLMREAWRAFETQRVAADATPAARQDRRRAFYGGATVMLTLLNGLADMSEADRDAYARQLREELATFAATVGTTLEGKV